MKAFFSELSLTTRIWVVLTLFTMGLFANTMLELGSTRSEIRSCYQSNVVHMVEAAKNILQHFHQRARNGELTRDEAQARALEAISAMRYDSGNYIFMGDQQGVAISNGIKELVGTNIMGMQDPTGLYLVRKLYDQAQSGGGFVNYQWPDPLNKEVLKAKTSYADLFEPWQWTLGTGLNMEALEQDLHRVHDNSLINFGLVVVSFGCVIFLFMNQIITRFRKVSQSLRHLAAGRPEYAVRLEESGGREMAELARSYNQLAENLEMVSRQMHQNGEKILKAARKMELDCPVSLPDKMDSGYQELMNIMQQVAEQTEHLQDAHHQLQTLVEKDELTGLLSRQAFEVQVNDRIEQIGSEVPHSLYILDFDNSQDLLALDQAGLNERLKPIADELRQLLPAGTFISRYKESGFIFWAIHNDFAEGMRLALQVHQDLQSLLSGNTISLGISSVIGDEKRYGLLHNEALRALLRAQSDGGAKVYEY
ncbi:cache domain-containing protein [Oceanospirillum sediminis]|uniref:Cache domain-containing protein n=1 Tax=Oceanospirillum sediminis TaxID=2760088 RepID=A0A839IMG4_9GAMM|nr:cache domain-containing protein [Oceanospirillum sediminis]MBB1486415.1 cache domain-containing protein [Oceanospirillum sediminis]